MERGGAREQAVHAERNAESQITGLTCVIPAEAEIHVALDPGASSMRDDGVLLSQEGRKQAPRRLLGYVGAYALPWNDGSGSVVARGNGPTR